MDTDIIKNHPLQKEVYDDPARFRIICTGRQFGKTTLLIEEALRVAYSIPNSISWLVTKNLEMGRETFWDRLKDRARDLNWSFKTNEHNLSFVRHKNNSKIYIKSSEQIQKLRGRTIDFAGIDEFRLMEEKIWDEIIRPALMIKRGKAVFASTPNGRDGIYRLYLKGQDTTQNLYKSWHRKSIDSPFADKEYIEECRRTMDAKTFRQEWEAGFEEAEGLVYYAFNREKNIKKIDIDYSLPLRLSFDFNVNPMTTSICQITNGNREAGEQERILNVLKIINTPNSNTPEQCGLIKKYLNSISYTGQILLYGDAKGNDRNTANRNTNWEIIKMEFPSAISKVPVKNPAVIDRVNCLNAKLNNSVGEYGVFINNENCNQLIRDFEEVSWKGNDIDKKKDDSLTHNSDNLGYLVQTEFPIRAIRDSGIVIG